MAVIDKANETIRTKSLLGIKNFLKKKNCIIYNL
jgi:hypothetical protein